MTRYALGIEYDGSQFCGWQVQSGVETVQEAIERALSSSQPLHSRGDGRANVIPACMRPGK